MSRRRDPDGVWFSVPGGRCYVPAANLRSIAKAKGVTEDEAAGMFIDAVRDEMDSVAGRVPDDASGAAGEWVVRPDHPVPDDRTGEASRPYVWVPPLA